MTERLKLERAGKLTAVVAWIPSLLVVVCVFCTPSLVVAEDSAHGERIAKMAMSTASLWMVEHHEHEMEEGLEKGDLAEALEEAEELIPWMKGTPWLHELSAPAQAATEALQAVVNKLKAHDAEGAKAAMKTMKMKFHHLHHELMEVVAGGKGGHKH